jgi:hypothetical protein
MLAWVLAAAVCMLPTACQSAPTTREPDPEIAVHERKWQQMRLTGYVIEYLLVEGPDGTPPAYRRVVVTSNSVLDTDCRDGLCPTGELRDLRMIHELFGLARAAEPRCVIKLAFDGDWHFPTIVQRSCPDTPARSFRVLVTGFSPRS